MKNKISATITFYRNNEDITRKSYVTLTLRNDDEGKTVFTCSGNMCGCAGQCLDEIRKFNSNPLFKEIYRLWKSYHLNDCHAGTAKQEKAIQEYFNETNRRFDYENATKYLESINLLYDTDYINIETGEGYKYGSAWLYRAIPEEDLQKIKHIIEMYS